MTYILPNATLATTYVDMYVWANQITNGLVGGAILLMILSMTFFGTRRYGATMSGAVLISLIVCSMISMALAPMGLITQIEMWIVFTGTMFALIASFVWGD